MEFDEFISHAHEDKAFAKPINQQLCERGYRVWFDEAELKIGDPLRRTIDSGLSKSRFGLVILSPAFFLKNWTNYELDGLATRENRSGKKVILPVWHQVSRSEVATYSLPLADRVGAKSVDSLDSIVAMVARVLGAPMMARQLMSDSSKSPFEGGLCRKCGKKGEVIRSDGAEGDEVAWFECKHCGWREGQTTKSTVPRWG